MLSDAQNILKGPFWLISDEDKEYLILYPVDALSKTPSHKDVWAECKGKIKKQWNYYPRGRVEIKVGKATVYANPLCYKSAKLKEMLVRNFNLKGISIEFKADNSAHYTDGVFGVKNTTTYKKEYVKCRK